MNVALRTPHAVDSLNILSLCTGGGGLDLGVELAIPSARTVCMVEREAFAVAQLVSAMEAGLMAPAAIWSDARTFDGRPWRGCVDGLIGGIPCQPHSLAGKRLGEEDERDLWSDARRIVVQSGAWFVVIENVRGMLSSGGAERVWRDLRRLGFASEGGLFTAAEVGASHERERFFILAVADRPCRARRAGPGAAGYRQAELQSGDGSGALANGHGQGSSLDPRESSESRQEFAAIERIRGGMDDALCLGREARRNNHRSDVGYQPDAASEFRLVDAEHIRRDRRPGEQIERKGRRTADEWSGSPALFPPRPGDLSGWRDVLARSPELEPAFRRVADGLATRMDIARVDRLRLLGNGVVSLEGAYAVRTLATRLAARGSAGAARLVRMMGDME